MSGTAKYRVNPNLATPVECSCTDPNRLGNGKRVVVFVGGSSRAALCKGCLLDRDANRSGFSVRTVTQDASAMLGARHAFTLGGHASTWGK